MDGAPVRCLGGRPGGAGADRRRGLRRSGGGRSAGRDGDADRRRRGAAHLRDERGRRADDRAAVGDHQRPRHRRQPARRLGAGGRHLRLRRLEHQHHDARLPAAPGRIADRHHDRRHSERHLGLLERRLEREPLRRLDQPRRRRRLAGHGRHRIALGGGAGRHAELHHRRAPAGAGLHAGALVRRPRRPAPGVAGRHRPAVRRRYARLVLRFAPAGDGLGPGRGPQRARARRGQGRVAGRPGGPRRLLLVRRRPRRGLRAPLLGGRVREQPALGPADRRLDGHALGQPGLPPRLEDAARQHVRLPEGEVRAEAGPDLRRRRLLPPAERHTAPGCRRICST